MIDSDPNHKDGGCSLVNKQFASYSGFNRHHIEGEIDASCFHVSSAQVHDRQ